MAFPPVFCGGRCVSGLLSAFEQVPCRRLDSEEVLYEEVVHLMGAVGSAHGVALAWQVDEFEVLVVFDELVDNLEC